MSSVIRVPETTKVIIAELARRKNSTQGEIVTVAVEDMKKKELLAASNEAYARLRADAKASVAFDKELGTWEQAAAADA